VRGELVERDARLAAVRHVLPGEGDERGEVGVAVARLGEQRQMRDERRCVTRRRRDDDGELRADDRRQLGLARGGGEADDPSELVVIGDRERGEPEVLRPRDERLGQRSAVEEGERGVGVELGVAHSSELVGWIAGSLVG
jgi:hypothetical protein